MINVKLHFLCYSSIRTGNHENLLDEISDILTVAHTFNKKHRITGVLYYSRGQFFQYIEGLEKVIEDLFDHIAVDSRHHYIHYYGTFPTSERRFKGWSMKYVQDNSQVSMLFEQRKKNLILFHHLSENNLMKLIDDLMNTDETTR